MSPAEMQELRAVAERKRSAGRMNRVLMKGEQIIALLDVAAERDRMREALKAIRQEHRLDRIDAIASAAIYWKVAS